MTGKLYGVGVGPGDPELLTLKAHRLLTQTPVICLPKRNLRDDGYAAGIVRHLLDETRQEILPLEFPMTRDWTRLRPYWEANTAAIYERVAAGRDCVFITEGDPFLYSTWIYMYSYFRRRHPEVEIEVIPGVSSFLAAAARVGQPLGNQEERIAIIPRVEDEADVERILDQFETVVFLKINSDFKRVFPVLARRGLLDRAVWVKKVGDTANEEVVTDISTLVDRRLEYLSLLLVSRSTGGVSHE